MAKESSASFKELMVVSKSPSITAEGIPISDARSRDHTAAKASTSAIELGSIKFCFLIETYLVKLDYESTTPQVTLSSQIEK